VRGTGVRCNRERRQKCALIEANPQATHCFGLPAAPVLGGACRHGRKNQTMALASPAIREKTFS
jgi:hypothetical protein